MFSCLTRLRRKKKTPAVNPGPTTPPPVGELRFRAYVTGYGWPDNTPPGSAAISHPVLHDKAGGIGTYLNPITVAVGHVIENGRDTLDYPAGTRFYIPAFRRYFIVEDSCGDGPKPQDGPCHSGKDGLPWLDVWCGSSRTKKETLAIEDTITGKWNVIQNPRDWYPVQIGEMSGELFSDAYPT